MSRAIDFYNNISYARDILTGKVHPLRLANDIIVKPLVYNFSRNVLGANEKEIEIADDIFEAIYSLGNLDPIASMNNISKAYTEFKKASG